MFEHVHQDDGVKFFAGRNHVVERFDGGAQGGGIFQRRNFFAKLVEAIFVWLEAGDKFGDGRELRGEVADAAADF